MVVVADTVRDECLDRDMLYVVWIETNLGQHDLTDWWANSDPQPLGTALYELADCRRLGFPTVVLPEGTKPSPTAYEG